MSKDTKGRVVIVLTLPYALAAWALHLYRGDAVAQISRYCDESSHFLTGVMIRDYVLSGTYAHPLSFAYNYYLHYPKVAFGSWPPLFHMCLAAWLLILPVKRISALLLIDVLTGMLGAMTAVTFRRRFPTLLAASAGFAVVLLPQTQFINRIVQADTLYAVLSMACVYAFARWLEEDRRSWLWYFGLTFFGALMAKNNAMFLGITLPLAIALSRSWRVLRRIGLWIATIPGVVACAVWQYFTLPFVSHNMTQHETVRSAFEAYALQFVLLIGIGFVPLILWGVGRRVLLPLVRRKAVEPFEAAMFGLLVGPFLFHSALPHDVNARYLIPAAVAMFVFAAEALADLFEFKVLSRIPRPLVTAFIAGALLLPQIPRALAVEPMPFMGYAELADVIVQQYPPQTNPGILVVASEAAEGPLVGEIAARDRTLNYWLLRSTKLLMRRVGPRNGDKGIVPETPDEMRRYLEALPTNLVILCKDADPGGVPQEQYMESVINSSPELWERLQVISAGEDFCFGPPCSLELYRLKSTAGKTSFSADRLPSGMPLWKIE